MIGNNKYHANMFDICGMVNQFAMVTVFVAISVYLLQVVDSAVLRFSSAVTHFSPGSYTSRPLQTTSFGNLFMAGDWVKGLDHGANGLSQERAYITGLAAANLVIQGLGHGVPAEIIPVDEDEPHVAAAKGANQTVQGFFEALPSPFNSL